MHRLIPRQPPLAAALAMLIAAGCDVRAKVLAPVEPGGSSWTVESARMADAVVDLIAVGTHLGAAAPADDNYLVARPLIEELRVRHAVDASSQPDLGRIRELGAAGVRFQLWIGALDAYFQSALAMAPAIEAFQVDALAGSQPALDQAWLTERRRFCDDLATAVKTARLGTIAIVAPDVWLPGALPVVDFGPCIDAGTVHRERTVGPPTTESLLGNTFDKQVELQRPRAAGRPLMLGRDGYSTDAADLAGSVSEIVQAKYLPRLLFEAFNRAFVRVYLGGVTDRTDEPRLPEGDPGDAGAGTVTVTAAVGAGEGLAHPDGTPKPSFTTMRNLIALLSDAGTPISTGLLSYQIPDAPETLHHTLLRKRNGLFVLVLWLEVPSTDAAFTVPVTLRFPLPAKQVTAFVPRRSATLAVGDWSQVTEVPISASDDVTVVEIAATNYCDRSMWTATASARGDNKGPPGAIDGDLTTRWNTSRLQDGTDWFQVDFGGLVKLTNITLNDTQIYPGDYPGAYEVRGSQDGVTFDETPFAAGVGTYGSTVINFGQQTVRAVKISQLGTTNNTKWWGIGEFQVACAL